MISEHIRALSGLIQLHRNMDIQKIEKKFSTHWNACKPRICGTAAKISLPTDTPAWRTPLKIVYKVHCNLIQASLSTYNK